MTTEKTIKQIIAEASEILDSKVKTVQDMRRLVKLSQELEERLVKGGTK